MNWKASDVITTDKYLEAFPEYYCKMDPIYLGHNIVWRGRLCSPPPPQTRVLITGHSDFPITDEMVKRYPNRVWFGVNNQSTTAIGIPLGVTNDTDESDVHRIYGNVDMMVEVAKTPREIRNLVYMNFTTNTYPAEREMVAAMFRHKEWVTVGRQVMTMEGRRSFLKDMRNHSYVLCPRGNGVDTHRIWEALYMGSIPIVLRDLAHAGWNDLPILFVDSWEDVTEELLRNELHRFQTTTWNTEKLRVGYWIDLIRVSVESSEWVSAESDTLPTR